jgi:hypothetical protein
MKNLVLIIFNLFVVALCSYSQLPSYLPTDGLVAWYPFNGNANDESGNGNNGLVNGASLTADRFNQNASAYDFNGIDNFIEVTHSPELQFFSNLTISCWVKIEDYSTNPTWGTRTILSKPRGYLGSGLFLYSVNETVGVYGGGVFNSWPDGYSVNSSEQLPLNDWENIILTYDGSFLRLYKNGEFINSTYSTIELDPATTPLYIGREFLSDPPNYSRWFKGSVDDIVLYNRALTQAEVTALYNATATNTGGGTTSTTPAPPGIPYQAEVRSDNGEVLANTNVNVRFTLRELTASGTVSYQETHALTTNELGLFAATIGAGTATQGTFAGINWAQTTKFLQVEVDAGNGYITMGNQQLMSVPYALYAANSQPGPQGPAGPQGSVGPQGPAGQYIAGSGIVINNDTISLQNSSSLDPTANRVRIGFATSTTWTCPVGVNQITIELWGAGGTSGSGSTLCDPYLGWTCYGASGGKGGYNKQLVDVIPGNTYTITVGQVNGGIQEVPCRMNNGGNSSFNNQYTALGGQGGRRGQGCCSCGSYGQGADGTVTNFSHPTTQLVVPTTYIPQSYVTNIYPSCCAPADTKGFVVISY